MNISGIEMETGKGVLAEVKYKDSVEVQQYLKYVKHEIGDFLHKLEMAYDFICLTNASLGDKKQMFDLCGDLVDALQDMSPQILNLSDMLNEVMMDYEAAVEEQREENKQCKSI
jgi:hypothetical protein